MFDITKYKKEYYQKNKKIILQKRKKYNQKNKNIINQRRRKWRETYYKEHPEKVEERNEHRRNWAKKYYKKHPEKAKEKKEKLKKYYEKHPWIKTWKQINKRCNHTKTHSYFKRGIKVLINQEELKKLWFRDEAFKLKQPSIDRQNSNGNYTFKNCRFIELHQNQCRKKNKRKGD